VHAYVLTSEKSTVADVVSDLVDRSMGEDDVTAADVAPTVDVEPSTPVARNNGEESSPPPGSPVCGSPAIGDTVSTAPPSVASSIDLWMVTIQGAFGNIPTTSARGDTHKLLTAIQAIQSNLLDIQQTLIDKAFNE